MARHKPLTAKTFGLRGPSLLPRHTPCDSAQAQEEFEQARSQTLAEATRVREAARDEAAAMTAEARRQVEELSRQRDAISAQLQSLRDTVAAAVGPLSAPPGPPARLPYAFSLAAGSIPSSRTCLHVSFSTARSRAS